MTEVLLLVQEEGNTLYPLQSTAVEEQGMVWPMGHRIGFGLMPKLLSPQQLMHPPPQVAVETL